MSSLTQKHGKALLEYVSQDKVAAIKESYLPQMQQSYCDTAGCRQWLWSPIYLTTMSLLELPGNESLWGFVLLYQNTWSSPSPLFFFQVLFLFFFSFFPIFISGRLITLQYCSAFCHTLTWIGHGFTCIPHPDPRSHLPLHPIPLGLPSAPAPSTCLMHPTWAGDLLHPR